MTVKFFTGIVVFFIAFILQAWFAGAGIYVTLIYATLISFAFIFGVWEMVFFGLLAVFLLNWQPAPSVEMLVVFLFPLAANLVRRFFQQWHAWIAAPVAIILGFVALYGIAAGISFSLLAFLIDCASGLLFGGITFAALSRMHGAEV